MSATKLENAWTFWYHRKSKVATESYEASIKSIASFGSVEEFWQLYTHLKRPDELPHGTDYHLFRAGVTPTWEDEQNRAGGKWIVRLKKGLVARYWEELLVAMVGEQLSDSSRDVCGAVVSIRYSEDSIAIWNRNARADATNGRIRQMIRKLLRLPSFVKLDYKPHEDSIIDNQRDEWRRNRGPGAETGQEAAKTAAGPPSSRPSRTAVGPPESSDGDGGWMKAQRRTTERPGGGGVSFRRNERSDASGPRTSFSGAASGREKLERPRGMGSWGSRADESREAGGPFQNATAAVREASAAGGERTWMRRSEPRKSSGDEEKDWRRRS